MPETEKITDAYVLSCYERKDPLTLRFHSLSKKLKEVEDELEKVEEELTLAEKVQEIYEGVPLDVYAFMGTTYATISDETERYGRVSNTIHGQFHAVIGDNLFGAVGERTAAYYLDDEDEAAEIVKRWIVKGEEPVNKCPSCNGSLVRTSSGREICGGLCPN